MELIGYTENNLPVFVKNNHPKENTRTYFVLFNREPKSFIEVKNPTEDFIHRPASWGEREQFSKAERMSHIKEKELKEKNLSHEVCMLIAQSVLKYMINKIR